MRYGPAPAPFWPWSWPAFHAPLALAIHYLSMSVGVSPSTVLVTPNLTPILPALFAFCQNGNEENLHGRCICGIFPPSRRFRCLHVLFNHFCFPSPHFPFPFRLHFLCSLAHSCLRFLWSFPWSPLAGSPFVLHFYAYFRMSWSFARLLRATIFEMRQLFANGQQQSLPPRSCHIVVATCSSFIMLTL